MDWTEQYFGSLMRITDSFEKTWCWERLKVGREWDDRGLDGWMVSPTQWTWVWTSSRVGDAIQPSHPLLSPSPPAFNLSQHQVFSNESVLHIRWPKYWSFSFNIRPSSEHPGLISIRMNWLDLLAVQGTLKSLLQHHSSKASIFQCSAFFLVQVSHPYMTTGKIIALTRWTFVGKMMSLLFNTLSR